MKTFLIILLVVALITIALVVYGKKIASNFDISTPRFVGADLKAVFNNTGYTTIDLSSTITNNNNFSVSVKNLYIEVYYLGQIVGKSTLPHDKFIIPANGSVAISQNITLAVSPTLGVAYKLLSGEKIEFQYMVKALVFELVPIKYTGSFTY